MECHRQLSGKLSLAYVFPVLPLYFLFGPLALLQGLYAKYFGLSLVTIATVLFISRVFDALIDPLVGYVADRYYLRYGSRKPFIMLGGVLYILSSWFLFVPPSDVSSVYFLFWFLVFFLAYTLFEIPHLAWASSLVNDAHEKNRLYGLRSCCLFLGGFLFYSIPLLPVFETNEFTPETLKWSVIVAGSMMLPALYFCITKVPENSSAYEMTGSIVGEKGVVESIKAVLRSVGSNRPFKIFVAACVFTGVGYGAWFALLFLFVDAYLGLGEKFSAVFMTSFGLGIIALGIWYKVAGRLGKQKTWLIGMLLVLPGLLGMWALSANSNVATLLILITMINCGFAAFNSMVPSLLSDIVDFGVLKSGADCTATYFSFYTLINKTVVALGGAIGFSIAGFFGFDPTINQHGSDAVLGLRLGVVLIPALSVLVSIVLIANIPINFRQHSIIKRRLMMSKKHCGVDHTISEDLDNSLKPVKPSLVKMVPMRDGVKLYTEIFLPSVGERHNAVGQKDFPVILSRSPYPYSCPSYNDKLSIERYLDCGYVIVFQLTRGQGKSEGVFHFFRDDIDDGYDAIEWISRQSWCNGKVGMQGPSYLGGTQLLAAKSKHVALKCIMPTAFVGNFVRAYPYSNGVPSKGAFMQWLKVADAKSQDELEFSYGDMELLDHPQWGAAYRYRPLVDSAEGVLEGDKLQCWHEVMQNPTDSEYWASIHFTEKELAELDLPIFFTDGWYDTTVGPIEFFHRMEKLQPERADRFLLVGPWDHYQTFSASKAGENNGDRILPSNGALDLVAQRLKFFERYLKDNKKANVQSDRVQIYITGPENSTVNDWYFFPTYPVPGTSYQKLYLNSKGGAHEFPGNGVLIWHGPAETSLIKEEYAACDHYRYDPESPPHSIVETSKDRCAVEKRADVLTYTSAPLTEPITILGDISCVLFASSSARDTDWFLVLTEVFPNGESRSFHYAPPAIRARYREGLDREILLTPGKPERYSIDMGAAGHQVAIGNRLRLSVFSAAFPEYDPNTNSGRCVATDCTTQIADQTVFHDEGRASYILLPTINL